MSSSPAADTMNLEEAESLIEKLVEIACQKNASDIHLKAGSVPALRVSTGLTPLEVSPFSNDDVKVICEFLVKNPTILKNAGLDEIDGSLDIDSKTRIRFNIFQHSGELGVVLRIISKVAPNLDDLKLPSVLKTISASHSGLVLVTGATGSGKSTTLAAMLNHINTTEACHIITIEDPIEYVHVNKKSQITQREVGKDTRNFSQALRAALRQDPDIILVGEMRDRETMDVALKAAETGHLVFSTVHTTDAEKTIARIVSMFPPEEQRAIHIRLSENLRAIVSQRLLPSATGTGKVVAQEILVNTMGTAEAIADPTKVHEIYTFMKKERDMVGSQTFDQHLTELYKSGAITLDTATSFASNRNDFELGLMLASDEPLAPVTPEPEYQRTPAVEAVAQPMAQQAAQAPEAPAKPAETAVSKLKALLKAS